VKSRPFVWYLSRAHRKFKSDRCPLLASALVHATAFSLFPLILGLLSVSLFILGSSEGIIDKIIPLLEQVFPVGIDEIVRNITLIRRTSIVFAVIGLLGFVWGAAGVFRAVESTLNVIWKVKRDRPFFKKNLLTISAASIMFTLLIVSVALTIWVNALGDSGVIIFLPLFNVVFSIVLFTIIYWLFPRRSISVKAAFVGALFTGVFWEIAKHLFSLYITKIVDYSQTFGSLSALILLFLWIYYSAYIFLFGAELGYVYERRKRLN
jgi:membrane protein